MDFHYRQIKINFMFFKILALSVIQNYIGEAFVTLESLGLSQSFLSSQLSENEVQKPGLPLYRVDAGRFLL